MTRIAPEKAQSYLERFPSGWVDSLQVIAYLLFVCKDLEISLEIEFDPGYTAQRQEDATWKPAKREGGYRIAVGQQADIDQETGEQERYASIPSLAQAGLGLLHAVLEQASKQEEGK